MALILDESWQFCQCGKRFGWAHQFTLEGKLDTFRRKAAENLNFENLNPLAMTKKDKPHTAIIFDELIFSDTKYLCTKFFKRAWGSVTICQKGDKLTPNWLYRMQLALKKNYVKASGKDISATHQRFSTVHSKAKAPDDQSPTKGIWFPLGVIGLQFHISPKERPHQANWWGFA